MSEPNVTEQPEARPVVACSDWLDGWRDGLYPFGEMKEGEACRVKLENGMEMEAYCYKHHPCGDHPELWDDDWITNDERCQDKKNGRLYGEQSVAMWKPSNGGTERPEAERNK